MTTAAALPAPGTISPATGEALEPVPSHTPEQVADAITAARKAQPAWDDLGLNERARLLKLLAQTMLADAETVVEIISQETGKGANDARLGEIATVAEYVADAIKAGRIALADEKAWLSFLDFPKKSGVIEMVPRGVVGIIAPWNYPLMQFYKPIFPALLAGNAVVLKPSEHTPRTGAWLAAKCQEVLPSGVVQLVQGRGEVGAALIEGGCDSIAFTGSVATGRKVALACAERFVPVSIELGGKDAAIVLADCNFDRTVAGLAWASMHNAGHDCAGVERIYVENAIADRFVAALAATAQKIEVSPNGRCDIGPCQNAAQFAIVQQHVDEAKAAGATVACGGEPTGSGYGYLPTVLDNCTQDMTVVSEETFGPVVAVIRVADAEEAIALANDSKYGLNGSVWTTDHTRGKRIARRLEVGIAHLNNHKWTGGTLAQTPWTGVKDTGPGIAAGKHSYHTFARPRMVMEDWNSGPEPFWFPFNDQLGDFSKALVQRGQGNFWALLTLLGLLGKRVKAATDFAKG